MEPSDSQKKVCVRRLRSDRPRYVSRGAYWKCSAIILRLIDDEPVRLSHLFNALLLGSLLQMDFLRMLKDSDNKQMVDNFRPLLPVNNRTVYSSFEIPGQKVMKPTTTEPPPSEGPSEGPTADATAVSMTAAPFLLMLVAALFKHWIWISR